MEPQTRDRAGHRRQARSLGRHAERRSHHRGSLRDRRRSARADVYVHKMHAGGGFGRRGPHQEYTKQAVKIAQTMPGTPVRLQWSREEDMRQGRYRPVSPGEAARRRSTRTATGSAGTCGRPTSRSSSPCGPTDDQERRRPDQHALLLGQSVHGAQLHQRVRDAQHACAAGILARGGAHQQPVLPRVLHRRTGARGGQGSVPVPPPAACRARRTWACSMRWRRPPAGARPPPKGMHRGIAVVDSYGSFTAAVVEIVGRATAPSSTSSA